MWAQSPRSGRLLAAVLQVVVVMARERVLEREVRQNPSLDCGG
jgi:hypothetical protein